MPVLKFKNPVTGTWEPLTGVQSAVASESTGLGELPSGGTAGQVLVKLSNKDGDVGWTDVSVAIAKLSAEVARLRDRVTKLEAS